MKYKIEITERIIKEYTIEADSEEEAELDAIENHRYEQETGVPEMCDVYVSRTERVDA